MESAWYYQHHFYTVVLERKGWEKIILHICNPESELSTEHLITRTILALHSGEECQSFEEIFENERKNHFLGAANYSKEALCFLDRSCWTDFNGYRVLRPDLRDTPSPVWHWIGDWEVHKIEGLTDEYGWMYASGWKKSWKAEKSFGKFVRRRLWVRKMALKKNGSCKIESRREVMNTTVVKTIEGYAEGGLDGVIVLSSILSKNEFSKEDVKRIGEIDDRLEFLSLKEVFLNYIEKLSPGSRVEYLHKLQVFSPRFSRKL